MKKSKYFIKFNIFWYLTVLIILGIPMDFEFIYYPYVVVVLILCPYMIMNFILWRVLKKHMLNKVQEYQITYYNAVRKSKKLGLQSKYCYQVGYWLNISWLALAANMLINFTDYTRWG